MNMNDIVKSSDAMAASNVPQDLRLSFEELPTASLKPPAELSSNRVPPLTPGAWLHLPVVVYRTGNSYSIVDGCKRVLALRGAGAQQVPCSIIGTPLDFRQAGLLRIQFNCGRALHLTEKLLFIAWLQKNCGREVYQYETARLGLTAAELHDCTELLSCSDQLIDAVIGGALDISIAPEIAHLTSTDAQVLIDLFSAIPLSRQMQRELAEWLPEIAFNRGGTLQSLVGTERLAAIVQNKRLNAPQKAAQIHGAAYEMRFPLYVRTRDAWIAHSRSLNPDPSHVSFHPSAWFEKNLIEIRIKSGDGASLQELMAKLAAVDASAWWKLIDPARIG
jgi:hypothetical protein